MLKQAYNDQHIEKLLPQGYDSKLTPQEKITMAHDLSQKIEQKHNLNIVAASIVGSTLRGVDHSNSDTDFLFLTDNKIKKPIRVDIEGNDSQVENVFRYASKLETSIPYMEFRQSPFLIIDDKYKAYILGQQVHKLSIMRHGTNFYSHVLKRNKVQPIKTLLMVMSTINLIYNGNSLMSRNDLHTQSELALFAKKILIKENMLTKEINELYENNVPLLSPLK